MNTQNMFLAKVLKQCRSVAMTKSHIFLNIDLLATQYLLHRDFLVHMETIHYFSKHPKHKQINGLHTHQPIYYNSIKLLYATIFSHM